MNPSQFEGFGVLAFPSNILVSAEMIEQRSLFLASGVYSLPQWAQFADIYAIGGGGSGANNGGDAVWAGSGGSAGSYVFARVLAKYVSKNIPVTVGPGGAVPGGAGNGNAGQFSSFGDLIYAWGGLRGEYTGGITAPGQIGVAPVVAATVLGVFLGTSITSIAAIGAGVGRRTPGWTLPMLAKDSSNLDLGSGGGINDTVAAGAGAVLVVARRFPSNIAIPY